MGQGALPVGDKLLYSFDRPAEELAATDVRDGQLAHLVAGQLQRAHATDAPVGRPLLVLLVVREDYLLKVLAGLAN
ncbi:MAG: hypothetical protein ACE5LU_19230 [Anaerolineae bacterium]